LLVLEAAVGLDHAMVTGGVPVEEVQRRCRLSPWVKPRFLTNRAEVEATLAGLVDASKWVAAAVLPLGLAGTELGVILVGFDHEDALDNPTCVTLSGVAAEASVALARARRFDVEHEIALTLQNGLLPTIDRSSPGWSVSTWYQPTSEMLVGGDLFDLTELDDGRMILIVGDVVGHGLAAAAAMGSLRSAAKALALVAARPADLIKGLHAFAAATPGVLCSSVVCVEVWPDGSARYACAGHPFPVLRDADGATKLLEGGRSSLLGFDGVDSTDAGFVMTEGSTLVVYTDGLIEHRGIDIDNELSRLRDFVGAACPGASALDVVEHMLGDRATDDDTVVVCLSRMRPVATSDT
jgi:serine phosphatase RsbU (regulator of sigma subunit)